VIDLFEQHHCVLTALRLSPSQNACDTSVSRDKILQLCLQVELVDQPVV